MNEPIRQHKRMAMGENIEADQGSGEKTHSRYAGGGHVHMHEHHKGGHHGHEEMHKHHPKEHHGGHTHDDLHGHHEHTPGRSGHHESHATGGECGTPGHKRSNY